MKSNAIKFGMGNVPQEILAETTKVAAYNGLDSKQTLRLRLLAEEVTSMLNTIVDDFSGEFWIENDGKNFVVNAKIIADEMSVDLKTKLVEVSSDGKNAAAKGIMGKIRSAIQNIALTVNDPAFYQDYGYGYGYNAYDMLTARTDMGADYHTMWTLDKYKADVKTSKADDNWDELEKSIIANLADNVEVGVRGKTIHVAISKKF